jgi:hypothetical protein
MELSCAPERDEINRLKRPNVGASGGEHGGNMTNFQDKEQA